MLSAKSLKMTYYQGVENHVLNGVDLDIEEGQFVTIVGKSGSGKSTLLYLLSGLEKPTEGYVKFYGKKLHELKDKEMSDLRRHAFGFIFQFFNLVSSLNVRDNIFLPITMERKLSKEQEAKVLEFVQMLGIEEKLNAYPHQLSGGQQQRVAIARALAIDPSVIFADEPTGNLDAQTSAEVLKAFYSLNKLLGKTIVMVTHDESIGKVFSTREIRLVNGRILGRDYGEGIENRLTGTRSSEGRDYVSGSMENRLLEGHGQGGSLNDITMTIKERSVDEHMRRLKERRRINREVVDCSSEEQGLAGDAMEIRSMGNRSPEGLSVESLSREDRSMGNRSIESLSREDRSMGNRSIESPSREDRSMENRPMENRPMEGVRSIRGAEERRLIEKRGSGRRALGNRLGEEYGNEDNLAGGGIDEDRLRLLQGRLGEHRPVEERSIVGRSGEDRLAEDRSGEDRSAEDRSAENRSGENRSGEGRPTENRSPKDRPPEGRSEDSPVEERLRLLEERSIDERLRLLEERLLDERKRGTRSAGKGSIVNLNR